MRILRKICTMATAAAILLLAAPCVGTNAQENSFDAYRKPFLSGPTQTWIYQGEEFARNRNKVFADDQEDGDLTDQIKQTGNVDTSRAGEYAITYRVSDSDGNRTELKTKVTVLAPGSGNAQAKKIQRVLYTLPDASHLTDIGFNRGYYHDRQSLGVWLPADAELKLRLVNYAEFGNQLELRLLNNDSQKEKSTQNIGGTWSAPTDSIYIPPTGEWVTVKNRYQNEGGEAKSADSVPFIYTPKNTTVQPIVELEWNDNLRDLPYYRYHDDEKAFFDEWNQSQAPFAVIEGQAATFLTPIEDKDRIINYPNVSEPAYRFHTIDEMLEWSADFVKQYDAYAGLDFHAAKPYNQNVRAKFFIKANINGAGLAYYSRDHSANNAANLGTYLCRDWVSLHEFGHGYEGAIASRENSFIETTNNIMGHYFEATYRPETDLGWLLRDKAKTKTEAYRYLGMIAEEKRNSVKAFNDLTEGQKLYDLTLFMFTNMLDCIGPQEATAAMHTQYRKYYYENKEHTSSSDVIIDSFSRTGGYNTAPYFDGWHIHASEMLEDRLYDKDLPMVYYLRNLIPDDTLAEQARLKLNAAGMALDGIYSLVSTDDLAKLSPSYESNVTLTLSIDDFSAIKGKMIQIKNGSRVAAEVLADQEELRVNLPIGIYEVELPVPRTENYQYGNEYLIASKGAVEKELVYTRAAGNPLADDAQVKMLGMSDTEVASLTLDTNRNQINCSIRNVEPHMYFTNPAEPYLSIRILNPQGKELFEKSLAGTGKAEAYDGNFDFPVGSKVEIMHREMSRLRFISKYTKKTVSEYAVPDNVTTVTFVMTERGLAQQTWGQEQRDKAYQSMLYSYSDFMKQNMTRIDLAALSKFHNAKLTVLKAWEALDEEAKQAYCADYGALIGEEPSVYKGYRKIDSALLKGSALSQQDSDQNAAANALDGDINTMWHSRYSGEDLAAGINNTYTITLPKQMDIGRLDYLPRQSGNNNGVILSYTISYSTKDSGDDFIEIPSKSNVWAEDKSIKTVKFFAPGAKRIRIAALSSAGTPRDRFISAAEFYLYEAYDVSIANTYLCDLYLNAADGLVQKYKGGAPVSLLVNGQTKSFDAAVGIPAAATASWDLEGKNFGAFTAWIGVDAAQTGNDKATAQIYGDGVLLYQSGPLSGKDAAESVCLDIAGIRELKVVTARTGGDAHVLLADAKLFNLEDKKELTLISGECVAVPANIALYPADHGIVVWSSSNSAVAKVDGNGIVTAVSAGDAKITAQHADGKSLVCSVRVKEAQVEQKDLTAEKEEAFAQLLAYKNLALYRAAQRQELEAIIARGKAAIDLAYDEQSLAEALRAAKAALDQVKTDAQLTQEESVKNQQNTTTTKPVYPTVGTQKAVGNFTYQIKKTGAVERAVAVVKAKKKTQLTIPATVKIGGYSYQITEIKAKAFRNHKKLTQVTIGKHVTEIGRQAFEGCKKLKKVTINSKKLKKVEKDAFAKIDPKAKITVPKGKAKSYSLIFQKAKLPKTAKIK